MFDKFAAGAAAIFLACAAPAAAQALPSVAISELESPEAGLAWVAKLSEAMNANLAAASRINEAAPLIQTMSTPAGLKAGASKLRPVIAAARTELRRSDALLAAVPQVHFVVGSGISSEQMLAQAKQQSARTLAVFDDFDGFLAAAERGDRATLVRLAPRLIEGSFLLGDSKALLLRSRQAAVTPSNSIFHLLGISAELSAVQSAAGRAWLKAKAPAQAGAAARALNERAAAAAKEIRTLAGAGRASLKKEEAAVDNLLEGGPRTEKEAAAIARLKAVVGNKRAMFALSDRVAAVLEASAGTPGQALAAQTTPELLGTLSGLELEIYQLTLKVMDEAQALARQTR